MDDWSLGAIPAIVLLFVVLGIQKYRATSRGRDVPPAMAGGRPGSRSAAAPPSAPPFMNCLIPPRTMTDPAAWDKHWRDQFSHGLGSFLLMFNDMFLDDRELVDAMQANGFKTVLCVGNGVSLEPHALQSAGFDVTALDLSAYANQVASRNMLSGDGLSRIIGNKSGHSAGRLQFVTGDLCDPACCPGPYDVVIERRTLQLYSEEERSKAMEAVAKRLAAKGIFASHCHDGRWKPPAAPKHPTGEWFAAQGWEIWYAYHGDKPLMGRVAWLMTTTG